MRVLELCFLIYKCWWLKLTVSLRDLTGCWSELWKTQLFFFKPLRFLHDAPTLIGNWASGLCDHGLLSWLRYVYGCVVGPACFGYVLHGVPYSLKVVSCIYLAQRMLSTLPSLTRLLTDQCSLIQIWQHRCLGVLDLTDDFAFLLLDFFSLLLCSLTLIISPFVTWHFVFNLIDTNNLDRCFKVNFCRIVDKISL